MKKRLSQSNSSVPFNRPSEEDVRRCAYDLYERSGCIPGRDVENWLEAERILRSPSGSDGQSPYTQNRPLTKARRRSLNAGPVANDLDTDAVVEELEDMDPTLNARSATSL